MKLAPLRETNSIQSALADNRLSHLVHASRMLISLVGGQNSVSDGLKTYIEMA